MWDIFQYLLKEGGYATWCVTKWKICSAALHWQLTPSYRQVKLRLKKVRMLNFIWGVYIHLHEWMLFIRWIRRYCTYASLMSHGSVIVMSNQSYVVIVCYFVWFDPIFSENVFFYWVVLSLFIWVTTSSQLPLEPKKKFCDLWSFVTSLSPTYSAWHIPCFHLSLCQC